jgi:ADA HAT complex component 1
MKREAMSLLSPVSASADGADKLMNVSGTTRPNLEEARETIQFHFGLEILLKHDELRLINQELAKCQIALEQLRRCHLIPYPVSCPTPEQMLQISSGTGPALQTRPGAPVPKWAPPFGVIDGPYARHYAKWLIPDPKFDGLPPLEPQSALQNAGRTKVSYVEGRATRNSVSEHNVGKGRPARSSAGQKLQALSSGYAQPKEPKEQQGPCVLKRSDGQTVKLICVDCHRWNFSSTQGFINHCRIAHKRDYKSHDEAAMHAGQPVELDGTGAIIGEEKPSAVPVSSPVTGGLVHPFARSQDITDQQAFTALISRIETSKSLFYAGKLPNVNSIPGESRRSASASASATAPPQTSFTGDSSTPYLSQLMQKRNFSGNLSEQVAEAKAKVDLDQDEALSPGEDMEEPDLPLQAGATTKTKGSAPGVRTPAPTVMRVPARTVVSPVPLPTIPSVSRPASSKSRARSLSFKPVKAFPPGPVTPDGEVETSDMYGVEDMDVELSPNTIASHMAPSLVSDDGGDDDSDDGSSSEASESMETQSVSDVAEINLDEDNDETPRPICHHRTSSATAVKLRKDEAKHVTFVTPLAGNPPPPGPKAKGRPQKHSS